MKSVARMLELSLASNVEVFQQRDARRAAIQELANPLKRRTALAIDTLAGNHPAVAARSLDGLARLFAGHHFIGQGAEFSVYGDGKKVIKVHRASVDWDAPRRERYVDTARRTSSLLCGVMGSMALGQDHYIGTHPLGGYKAILAEQPFVRGEMLPLFITCKPTIDRAVANDYCTMNEGGEASLVKLVDLTHTLFDSEGIVPDTNGTGNFIATGPRNDLVMIDPLPVTDSMTVDMVRRQVDDLAAFLAA